MGNANAYKWISQEDISRIDKALGCKDYTSDYIPSASKRIYIMYARTLMLVYIFKFKAGCFGILLYLARKMTQDMFNLPHTLQIDYYNINVGLIYTYY